MEKMYRVLNTAASEIRLLRLLPGTSQDSIAADIITTSLNQVEPFEALSYVWGNPADAIPITLAGMSKSITTNLHEALQKLRLASEPRTLWVDALCIDQGNIDERNQQVRIMHEIYAKADRVLVCLGTYLGFEDIVSAIELLAHDLDVHWTDPRLSIDSIFRIFDVLNHEWWRRIWTVQEAAVARSLVFVYDGRDISDTTLMGLFNSHAKHRKRRCCNIQRRWSIANTIDLNNQLVARFAALQHLLAFRTATISPAPRNLDLSTVASMFRFRKATDQRDKVYALIGLSSSMQTDWVDYGLSVEETYETAARASIVASRRLDVLSHATPFTTYTDENLSLKGYEKSKRLALPSWVPDWSLEFDLADRVALVANYQLRFLDTCRACGQYDAQIDTKDPPGSFGVSGIPFDVIETIASPRLSITSGDLDTFHEWRSVSGVDKNPMAVYVGGTTRLDAFWRTLCLDSEPWDLVNRKPVAKADDNTRAGHDEWWFRQLLEKYQIEVRSQVAEIFDLHVLKCSLGRAFFVSKKGYFGLAPSTARAGDLICVLAGGRPSFVLRYLRETPLPGYSSVPGFTLVGDCYVHGIMDGEAMLDVASDKVQLERWALL
jgi:hypothetical protein